MGDLDEISAEHPPPLSGGASSANHTPLHGGVLAVARRRGVRVVGVLLGVSLVSGGVGWVAARGLRSPADVAARSAAPLASRITAPVEFRELRSTLFTRGTVRFGSPRPVTLPVSAAKVGSLVVTSAPVKGAVLVEGSRVGDVGGRPVLVLAGPVPMYRDIRPGDSGADVAELKAALVRLGFAAGTGAVFDESAERAVTGWMRSVGYEPFGPTPTELDRLRTATDAAHKADEAILSARDALTKASIPPSPDKVLAADEAVRTANDRATAARSDAARSLAQAELSVTQKQIALNTALNAVSVAEVTLQRAQTDVSGVISVADAEQNVATAKQRVTDLDAAVVKANRGVDTAMSDRDDADAAVVDAQQAVTDAEAALVTAQSDLVKAKAKPPALVEVSPNVFQSDTASAEAAVRQAEATVKSAQVSLRTAQTQLRAAQRTAAKAAVAIDDAKALIDPAVAAAAQARDAVKIAELRLTQAQTGGSSGSGTGSAGAGSAGAGAASSAGQAQAQLDQAKAQVGVAQTDLDQATAAVPTTKRAGDAAVRAADAQARIAVAQRVELSKPADVVALSAAVKSAQDAKVRVDADLAKLEASTGTVVPANEVVFFPVLPLRVDDTKLVAGDALTGAFMTVASQRLAVDASVDPADAPSLHVGQNAEIESTDLNITVPATITKIASQTGTNGADASRVYIELSPVDEPTTTTPNTDTPTTPNTDAGSAAAVSVNGPNRKPSLTDLNGQSVKVTVPISSTGGKVLVVPTPAVSAAADGTTRVEVEDSPDKPTRFVTVNAGLRAEGYVQITPASAGTLHEGDLVVTGTKDGQQLQGAITPNDRSQPGQATPATTPVPGT